MRSPFARSSLKSARTHPAFLVTASPSSLPSQSARISVSRTSKPSDADLEPADAAPRLGRYPPPAPPAALDVLVCDDRRAFGLKLPPDIVDLVAIVVTIVSCADDALRVANGRGSAAIEPVSSRSIARPLRSVRELLVGRLLYACTLQGFVPPDSPLPAASPSHLLFLDGPTHTVKSSLSLPAKQRDATLASTTHRHPPNSMRECAILR